MLNKAEIGGDVPEDRISLLEHIVDMGSGRIMITGPVDSGKTFLTTFLAQNLPSFGTVEVMDSDVGQKSILPPATITLASVTASFSSLSSLVPKAHYFVGTVAPEEHIAEMVAGVSFLSRMANSDYLILDTTGFIEGNGLRLKRLKAEVFGPNLIVVIGDSYSSERLARALSDLGEVVRLSPSSHVIPHSRDERRTFRSMKWTAYFSNSREIELSLKDIRIFGTDLFGEREMSAEELKLVEKITGWKVLGGWESGGKYTVLKAGEERRHYPSIKAIDFNSLGNLLLGLIGNGRCLGLGILKWINIREGILHVLTPVEERIDGVIFGRMRVTETGIELGLLPKNVL